LDKKGVDLASNKESRYIETEGMSLSEWLQLLAKPPKRAVFIDYRFLSEQHKTEYLAKIHQKSDADVISLIRRFLIPSSCLGIDKAILKTFLAMGQQDPEMHQKMAEREFIRRLLRSFGAGNPPSWEGITWILDLLPNFPRLALEGLNAYFMAHAQWLPDGRFEGLSHAIELVRAKFIGDPGRVQDKAEFFHKMDSREFECLVERLYDSMRYETELTPPRSDGGRDVIARRLEPGRKEDLRIECKRHTKPVGVEFARRLLGVVSSDKATKGVLVATIEFTKGAREFARLNPRIELVSGTELVVLLNEHLGSKWVNHLERLVAESLREKGEAVPVVMGSQADQPSASLEVRPQSPHKAQS
jgi:restriction system protein